MFHLQIKLPPLGFNFNLFDSFGYLGIFGFFDYSFLIGSVIMFYFISVPIKDINLSVVLIYRTN